MIKNISIKIILLTAIILDIILFILFGNGITLFINQTFISATKLFGYCTILNLPAIVGIEIILFNVIDIYLSKKRFTAEVEATCIGNNPLPFETREENNQTYITSWEYEYNNKLYVVKNSVSTNIDTPKMGSTRKIYINPLAPDQKYYDPTFTKKVLPILIIIAIACIYAYVGILDVGLMNTTSTL